MSGHMLKGGYLAVMEAKTLDEFAIQIIRFAEELDFKFVNTLVVTDHPQGDSEFQAVDNTPAGYLDVYNDHTAAKRDPVMQHCKKAAVPIVWDQETYVSQGAGDFWECQAEFGYSTGVAMALHLPGGRHFFLGVDRDRPLSKNVRTMTRVVADLQLFAVHAQEAAFRLLPSSPPKVPDSPALTPRELEALRWTMEGKTAWEVGVIMNISERTSVLHLQNAMHKLSCINKHQAVLKALRFGLLK